MYFIGIIYFIGMIFCHIVGDFIGIIPMYIYIYTLFNIVGS